MTRITKQRSLSLYNKVAPLYGLLHHIQTLWADDIHRESVVTYANLKSDYLVLDAGTGTGLTAIMACRHNSGIRVIGVDISEKMLLQAKKNIEREGLEERIKLVNADLEALPFKQNSFDAVISAYGLGGVENPQRAVEEIIRTAKSGAKVAFADISDVPPGYFIGLRPAHKYLIAPLIKYLWEFEGLRLRELMEENGIDVKHERYYKNRILGSTMLVS